MELVDLMAICLREKLYGLVDLKRNIKNWYLVPLLKYNIIKEAKLITKQNKAYCIKNKKDYYDFFNSSKVWWSQKIPNYDKEIKVSKNIVLFRNKIKFAYYSKEDIGKIYRSIHGIFLNSEYKVNVKGKIVIDIGSQIGDTAIYFATLGARQVIGFEPFPHTFNLAKKNIKLNGMQNSITIFNYAIGSRKEKFIWLPVSEVKSEMDSVSLYYNKNKINKTKIKVVSLMDIVKRFPCNDAIVKMDCEGCEYESILESENAILRNFAQFVIEYHKGNQNIINKLKEAGFETNIVKNIIYAKKRRSDE